MSISFQCDCGKKLAAKESFAGRRLKCPGCGKSMLIPKPRALATQLAGARSGKTVVVSPGFVHFACDCGRKMRAKHDDIGLEIDCPKCGTEMTIPAGDGAAAPVGAHGREKKQNGKPSFAGGAVGTIADSRVSGTLVRFACTCGRKMKARQADSGSAIDCPRCGREMTIPEADYEPQPVAVTHSEPEPMREVAPSDDDASIGHTPTPFTGSEVPPLEPVFNQFAPMLEPATSHAESPAPEDEVVEFLPDPDPVVVGREEEPVTFLSEAGPVTTIAEEEPVTLSPERDPVTTIPEPAPATAKALAEVPALAGGVDTLIAQHLAPWRDEQVRQQSGKAPPERKVRSFWLLPIAALIAVGFVAVEWYLVQETRGNPRKTEAAIGPLDLVPAKAVAMTTFRVADIVNDQARSAEGVKSLVKAYLKEKGFDQIWNVNDIARFTIVLMESDPARTPRPPTLVAMGGKGDAGKNNSKGPPGPAGMDEIFIVQTRSPYDQNDLLLRFFSFKSYYRTHVAKRGYWKSLSWDVDKAVCLVDPHTFVLGTLGGVHQFVHEQNTEGTPSLVLDAAQTALHHDFVVAINLTRKIPFAQGVTPPPLKAFQTALVTVDDVQEGQNKEQQWALQLVFDSASAVERADSLLHQDFLKSTEISGSTAQVVLQTTGRGSPEVSAFLGNVLNVVNRNSRLRPR